VSEMMQAYWANFVKTGDPNGPNLPRWPAFSSANNSPVMRLDVNAQAVPEQHRARYEFLERFYSQPAR